jgi:hypothetical protein
MAFCFVLLLLLACTGTVTEPDGSPQVSPTFQQGKGSVPQQVKTYVIASANSRFCASGEITHVASEASATLGDALRMIPANDSLTSWASPPVKLSSSVYDLTLTGRCKSGGHTVATIEVIVLAANQGMPQIVGVRGRYVGRTHDVQPFGQQWNA